MTDLIESNVIVTKTEVAGTALNKSAILDSLFLDKTIFTKSHSLNKGNVSAKSYVENIAEALLNYKRCSSEGYFYIGQLHRSLVLTMTEDTKVVYGEPPLTFLRRRLEALEAEADNIIAKHFNDQVVLVYSFIATHSVTQAGVDTHSRYASLGQTFWTKHQQGAERSNSILNCQPYVIICPLSTTQDLLYPTVLNSSTDRWRRLLGNKNYTGFKYNIIIHRALSTLCGYTKGLNIDDINSVLYNIMFLQNELFDKFLASNSRLFTDLLQDTAAEDMPLKKKLVGVFNLTELEDVNPVTGHHPFDLSGSRLPSEGIIALRKAVYNGKDILSTLQKYDHVDRKSNSLGLCDSCSNKITCLLDGDSVLPDPIVCRNKAIVSALDAASKELGTELLSEKQVPLLIPVSNTSNAITHPGLCLLAMYARDTSQSDPEDWLAEAISTETLSLRTVALSDASEDAYNTLIARILRAFSGRRQNSALLLEKTLKLSPAIKRAELRPVRKSNNNAKECYMSAVVTEAKAVMASVIETYAVSDPWLNKAASMYNYLISQDIYAVKERSLLVGGSSSLEQTNKATAVLSSVLDTKQFLFYSGEAIRPRTAMLDLYTLTYAGLAKRNETEEVAALAPVATSPSIPNHDYLDTDFLPRLKQMAEDEVIVSIGKRLKNHYRSIIRVRKAAILDRPDLKAQDTSSWASIDANISILFEAYVMLAEHVLDLKPVSEFRQAPTHAEKASGAVDAYLKLTTYRSETYLTQKGDEDSVAAIKALGFTHMDPVATLILRMREAYPELSVRNVLYAMIALSSYQDRYIIGDIDKYHSNDVFFLEGRGTSSPKSSITARYAEFHVVEQSNRITIPITIETNGDPIHLGINYPAVKSDLVDAAANALSGSSVRYKPVSSYTRSRGLDSVLQKAVKSIVKSKSAGLTQEQITAEILTRLSSKKASVSFSDSIASAEYKLTENANTVLNSISGYSFNTMIPSYRSNTDVTDEASKLFDNTNAFLGCANSDKALPAIQVKSIEIDYRHSENKVRSRCNQGSITKEEYYVVAANDFMSKHIALSESIDRVSHTVIDLVSIDTVYGLAVYKNIKQGYSKLEADYCGETVCDDIYYHNVWELDYSALDDIRVALNKRKTLKIDTRLATSGRMSPELGARAVVPLTTRWQRVAAEGASIEDLVLAELLAHKAIISDIIREKALMFFPDYDYDLTKIVNTKDIEGPNSRSFKRLQLRHITFGKTLRRNYHRAEFAIQQAIVQAVSRQTGLVTRGKFTHTGLARQLPEGMAGYDYLDLAMHESGDTPTPNTSLSGLAENSCANVIFSQLGVLKDFIIEQTEDTYELYWHLHGSLDWEDVHTDHRTTLRKMHAGRETLPRLESSRVIIKRLSGDSGYNINAPHMNIDTNISETELAAYIRTVVLDAFKYTYKSLFSQYEDRTLPLVNRIVPIETAASLITDTAYSYVPYILEPQGALQTSRSTYNYKGAIEGIHEINKTGLTTTGEDSNTSDFSKGDRLLAHSVLCYPPKFMSMGTEVTLPELVSWSTATRPELRLVHHPHIPYRAYTHKPGRIVSNQTLIDLDAMRDRLPRLEALEQYLGNIVPTSTTPEMTEAMIAILLATFVNEQYGWQDIISHINSNDPRQRLFGAVLSIIRWVARGMLGIRSKRQADLVIDADDVSSSGVAINTAFIGDICSPSHITGFYLLDGRHLARDLSERKKASPLIIDAPSEEIEAVIAQEALGYASIISDQLLDRSDYEHAFQGAVLTSYLATGNRAVMQAPADSEPRSNSGAYIYAVLSPEAASDGQTSPSRNIYILAKVAHYVLIRYLSAGVQQSIKNIKADVYEGRLSQASADSEALAKEALARLNPKSICYKPVDNIISPLANLSI